MHPKGNAPLAMGLSKGPCVADPVGSAETDCDHHAMKPNKESTVRRLGSFGEVDGYERQQAATANASKESPKNHHRDMDGTALEGSSDDS